MDPHQTDAGFLLLDAVVRRPAKAVHGEKKMREEGQGDRSRSSAANYQIRSDLNVEFGNMNLWDDTLVITEAAKGAIELYSHAVIGEKLEHDKAKAMFNKVAHVLAWCFVHVIAESVKRESEEARKESEGYYDDPNM